MLPQQIILKNDIYLANSTLLFKKHEIHNCPSVVSLIIMGIELHGFVKHNFEHT